MITNEKKVTPNYKRRKLTKFLAGPISWVWLTRASQLPGHSIHLAIVLQHLRKLKKSEDIRVSIKCCEDFGIKRNAVYRSLELLKSDGLITYIGQESGKCKTVRIVGE